MNTLYLYDGDVQTKKIAVMLSRMVSMGRYLPYDSQTIDWTRYGRVVFIFCPKQQMFTRLASWREKLAGKKLVLLYAGTEAAYVADMTAAVQAHLDQPLALTAFISAENAAADTIAMAQQLRNETESAQNDPAAVKAMEDFLQSHNTGVLATGSDSGLRATPLEYLYFQKKLYFFSEGGEKFIHLCQNPRAAFAVFEPFTDAAHLAGLQIEGPVRFFEPGDATYEKVAAAKGIAPGRLEKMAVLLHLIELQPKRLTFLWSGFLKEKKAIRQIYDGGDR